jgi:hypothetical protein
MQAHGLNVFGGYHWCNWLTFRDTGTDGFFKEAKKTNDDAIAELEQNRIKNDLNAVEQQKALLKIQSVVPKLTESEP